MDDLPTPQVTNVMRSTKHRVECLQESIPLTRLQSEHVKTLVERCEFVCGGSRNGRREQLRRRCYPIHESDSVDERGCRADRHAQAQAHEQRKHVRSLELENLIIEADLAFNSNEFSRHGIDADAFDNERGA